MNCKHFYQLIHLIEGKLYPFKIVISCLLLLITLALVSSDGYAQIKVSDRKSAAYKESRKNKKNKKRREKRKRYRKASLLNQTSGELEITPEALREQYVPKNQNAEKNPSKAYSHSNRKQKRKYTRKANQAKRQGMTSKDTYKSRQRNYRKQSSNLALHQGNIRVEPYVLRSRQGLFPQPPVDDTPGRTNIRKRNERLSQYAQKSDEILSQGLYGVKSRKKSEKQRRRTSNEIAFNQGTLSNRRSRKDDTYMAKSVEAQQQGLTIKNKSLHDRKQLAQSNSLAQSRFQGNLRYNVNKQQDTYMAKSVEAQQQGLTIKNKSLRDRKQLMQSNSLAQSRYQGNLKLNQRNKEDIYMAKSVELLNSGLTLRQSDRQKEAMYIRKSIEASKTGLERIRSYQNKDENYIGKSVEMLSQGLYKGQNIQDRESQYIRKSIEMMNTGLVKGTSKSARESQLKKSSEEVMSYSGDLKYISERKKDAQLKDASQEIFKFTGDFKVQRRLFERMQYTRLSRRQKKFDGMDEENRIEQWWASIWKKPLDQKKKPEPLRKPRYDSKEHEIWFY